MRKFLGLRPVLASTSARPINNSAFSKGSILGNSPEAKQTGWSIANNQSAAKSSGCEHVMVGS